MASYESSWPHRRHKLQEYKPPGLYTSNAVNRLQVFNTHEVQNRWKEFTSPRVEETIRPPAYIGEGIETWVVDPQKWPDKVGQAIKRLYELKKDQIFGIQCEWRPHNDKIATLTLSSSTCVILIKTHSLEHLPRQVLRLLRNEEILFVTNSWDNAHEWRFANSFQKGLKEICSNVIDLHDLCAAWGDKYSSLKHLARLHLGCDFQKSKFVTTSNWEENHLSIDQIRHTIIQALAIADVYRALRCKIGTGPLPKPSLRPEPQQKKPQYNFLDELVQEGLLLHGKAPVKYPQTHPEIWDNEDQRSTDTGQRGRPVNIKVNHFRVICNIDHAFNYDVAIEGKRLDGEIHETAESQAPGWDKLLPAETRRRVIRQLSENQDWPVGIVYDGRKNIYACTAFFPPTSLPWEVEATDAETNSTRAFKVTITRAADVQIRPLLDFVTGGGPSDVPGNAIQALDGAQQDFAARNMGSPQHLKSRHCPAANRFKRLQTSTNASSQSKSTPPMEQDDKHQSVISRRALLASQVVATILICTAHSNAETLAQAKSRRSTKELRDIIVHDFQSNQYYVTGKLTKDIFTEDCVFEDPTTRVVGVEKYSNAVALLFDKNSSRADLISINIDDPNKISTRWRFAASLNVPGAPKLKPYTGSTVYTVNEEGKISAHTEEWDISALDAFVSILFPSFGAKPAEPIESPVET